MRGDDGVGIVMTLQDHERTTDLENSHVERLKKTVENLEKTLETFTGIKQKYNGLIDIEKCTGKELNILITFVFPDSGLLSKLVAIKKVKFCERGINPQNINFLAEKEDKKLTQLKL